MSPFLYWNQFFGELDFEFNHTTYTCEVGYCSGSDTGNDLAVAILSNGSLIERGWLNKEGTDYPEYWYKLQTRNQLVMKYCMKNVFTRLLELKAFL